MWPFQQHKVNESAYGFTPLLHTLLLGGPPAVYISRDARRQLNRSRTWVLTDGEGANASNRMWRHI